MGVATGGEGGGVRIARGGGWLGFIGVILAILVLKTKNLFTAIIAHTGYNIISYILYLLYS